MKEQQATGPIMSTLITFDDAKIVMNFSPQSNNQAIESVKKILKKTAICKSEIK